MNNQEKLIYETPDFTYWEAAELDGIEAQMSGGGGSSSPKTVLDNYINLIIGGSIVLSLSVIDTVRQYTNNVLEEIYNILRSRYGSNISRNKSCVVLQSVYSLFHETPAFSPILRQYNRTQNQSISTSTGYLTHQTTGIEGTYKYGVWTTNNNGCEIIALHNALYKLGKNNDMRDLLDYFEIFGHGRILYGLFGTSPWGIEDYLTTIGVDAEIREERNDGINRNFDTELSYSNLNIGIFTFWWGSHDIHIHTVFVEKTSSTSVTIYNYSSNNPILTVSSLENMIQQTGIVPISLIVING